MTISLQTALAARGQDIRDLKIFAKLPAERLAALCGRSLATVKRWERTRTWPPYVWIILAYHAGFFIWEGWEGWVIEDGLLYPPWHRYGHTAADVAALHWLKQLARFPGQQIERQAEDYHAAG